jgi:hypothetical protein
LRIDQEAFVKEQEKEDIRDKMTAEEQQLFPQCIPWTRVIGERETDVAEGYSDLVADIKKHQQGYLLYSRRMHRL